MHYQHDPHAQAKLVSCVGGAVYDVFVDLRKDSPTYLQWHAEELKEGSGKSVFIPAGCAHGFISLTDNATVSYLIEGAYAPQAAATLRWNDAAIGIQWPFDPIIISVKDREAPGL